jgi:sodium/proline symporter
MATKEEEKLTLSRRIATVWVVISMGVAIFIGIIGRAMSANGTITELTGNNSETILIQISNLLSSHGLGPAIIAGVILSGILAATMSTADSQLLAASSAVSQNIMVDFFRVKISTKQAVFIARMTVVIISVIAVFLAKDPDSSVFKIVSFAWAGFGAAFGPAMLLALYWKRSNKWGALCGMLSGAVMIFVWKFAIRPLGGAWDIYELLPAFIIALVVNVVVSLITAKPDDEIVEGFDEMANISSIE